VSKRLLLVRHGATDWSDAGRLTGWKDIPLNERGREQARHLREQLVGVPLTGIWSSDLDRAMETAKLAAGSPQTAEGLREIDLGDLEGATWDEIDEATRAALVAFDDFSAPGGESVTELRRRVTRVIEELPPGTHLVITHGGVIRLLLRDAGLDDRPITPCEVVEIEAPGVDGGRSGGG
jgi:2,3-bisphosphoglycerate-dependent phosphoglycerate mutase